MHETRHTLFAQKLLLQPAFLSFAICLHVGMFHLHKRTSIQATKRNVCVMGVAMSASSLKQCICQRRIWCQFQQRYTQMPRHTPYSFALLCCTGCSGTRRGYSTSMMQLWVAQHIGMCPASTNLCTEVLVKTYTRIHQGVQSATGRDWLSWSSAEVTYGEFPSPFCARSWWL
jgi:hypothetical protein